MKAFLKNQWSFIVIGVLAIIVVVQLVTGAADSPSVVERSLSATYDVEGEAISLLDGRHFAERPGGAQNTATWMYGLPVTGDINGDGNDDAGVLLLRSSGGNERLCYIAAVVSGGTSGAGGTNAIALGNGVAINYCMISDSVLTVSLFELPEGSSIPVESKRYFTVIDGSLIELTQENP